MPKICQFLIAGLLLGAGTVQPAVAAQRWIKVTTSHFEMYTTNNPRQAERALQKFEQVRYFFLRNSRGAQNVEAPVRIIAFSSEGEFKPYRLNNGTFAYYLQSRERDYIVMQDIEPDHLQAAAHEYTHLIIRHMKLELPLWLEEGVADLYSSLEPQGDKALVGRPLVSHVITLQTQPWMDLNALFAVDHDSPWYNQADKMQIFYAESWELTHMLSLGPGYGSRFPEFLRTVSGGASAADALQKVYGKSVAEVTKDAQNYARRTSVKAAVFDVALKKSDLDLQQEPLSDFQTGLALCDLLASRPETVTEARRRLLILEQQNAKDPDVEESLGYLEWQQNNALEARKHFRLAAGRGSKDGRMYYDYAGLEHAALGPTEATVDLMKKAVELRPDDNESRILLAQLMVEARLPGQAITVLAPIHSLEPGQAFNFYSVSAYGRADLKDLAGARTFISKAASYAKTPVERQQVEQLTHFLDEAEHPHLVTSEAPTSQPPSSKPSVLTRPVDGRIAANAGLPQIHGVTKSFQCGQHTFRLHLQAGNREMVFAMDNPADVIVRNVKELQWSCGTLSAREVTVIYKPADNAKLDGTVVELVF